MAIAKYGMGLVAGSWIVFFIFLVLAVIIRQPILTILAVLSGIFSIFNMFFFRDPERSIPADENAVLSPADGKVVEVVQEENVQFFNEPVTRISIFLSVFNVHVNRVPFSGKVEHLEYRKGSFMAAFKPEASGENEQTIIGIEGPGGRRVMFKQIAGLIARRIICELREGYSVTAGDRMGMIRYGSRVDVFFPAGTAAAQVKVGQHVKGGESVLGVFR
ncbi:MAG: phosphatidylserine decarboxylase family protein [Calditrichia bacterium]